MSPKTAARAAQMPVKRSYAAYHETLRRAQRLHSAQLARSKAQVQEKHESFTGSREGPP